MPTLKTKLRSRGIALTLAMMAMFSPHAAQAADGCKFLLCVAGPWASISQCVPTVHKVLRDLALGRSFPVCDMSGAGNSANNAWLDEASCPGMYHQYNDESGAYMACTYPARISVYVNGELWSQVYWDMSANTSTWYSETARAKLEQPDGPPLDDRYLNDLTNWNTPRVSQCISSGGTVVFDAFGAFQQCNAPDGGGGG
jgi:hypothetical protein